MQFRLFLALVVCACAGYAQQFDSGTWRGRKVVYEVRDGLAIAEGDMILGTYEELVASRTGGGKEETRSAIAIIDARYRWPDGVIPYEIEAGVPDQGRITRAIEHWNSKTALRLIARTTEPAYVRFTGTSTGCSSNVGRVGGRQSIALGPECAERAVIHEIGHAVGLYHEQAREDRDLYIRFDMTNVDKRLVLANYDTPLGLGADYGPYDYGSIMHYEEFAASRNGRPVLQSIPPGIVVGVSEGLSPHDLDAVRRMYGHENRGITVATYPAGLELEIDGQRLRSPQTFSWAPGERHTIAVPAVQSYARGRHVFALWSDGGAVSHTVTVDPANTTVYTANFVRQYRFPLAVTPANGGTLTLNPPPIDGAFYPAGTLVEVRANPSDGFHFTGWSGFNYVNLHGPAANPVRLPVFDGLEYTARFSTVAPVIVTSEPEALKITVDGREVVTPAAFQWTAGSTHTVNAAKTSQTSGAQTRRHAFLGWSDGGDASHELRAEGQTISARFSTQHQVTVSSFPSRSGQVQITPPSTDGYYDEGTVLTLTPSGGTYRFAAWDGDVSGSETPAMLVVNDQKWIAAVFGLPGVPVAVTSAASFIDTETVAPGQIVTLFGVGFGPETLTGLQLTGDRVSTTLANTRVLFDGNPAPLLYVAPGQIAAIAPYSIARRTFTTIRVEYGGRQFGGVTVAVVPAAPALFTADSSGSGQAAALNQNGTVNSPYNPAARGSVIVLYGTGEGETNPGGIDGKLTDAALMRPQLPVRVTIGGREAPLHYAGSAPGMVAGVLQLNAQIPADCPSGNVTAVVHVGEASSPRRVTIAVQ